MSRFKPASFDEARENFKPMRRKQMSRGKRRLDNLPDEERAKRRQSRPLRHARSDKKRRGQEWSKSVKERDGWKCTWPKGCQTGDTRIDAHHIAPRSRRPDLKYELSNGMALCRAHHDWVGNNPIEAEQIGLNSFETYEAAMKSA